MRLEWIQGIEGGALIGIAVSIMLLFNGRSTGVSGIINNSLCKPKEDNFWRYFFIFGLIFGGFILQKTMPAALENPELKNTSSILTTISAGLLVGFGTVLGNGCTSGHGICGISRLSVRSIVATLVFMIAGMISVFLFQHFWILK